MSAFLSPGLKKYNRIHFFFTTLVIMISFLSCRHNDAGRPYARVNNAPWYGWNEYQIKPEDSLVRKGYSIIANTSYYFGPKGRIAAISNGMNCQNCHIHAGIIPWGNNFSAAISTYPRFNYRSGKMMSLARRINDCFERSLNGSAIDTASHEMQAILAYFHWLGDSTPMGTKPLGSGIVQLSVLSRAADPLQGLRVYMNTCQRCHGAKGEGQASTDALGYIYPPLWGETSYNTGAGLYRLSNFAGFIKINMPLNEATYDHPILSDEEAWDVAAYVNSRPRPLNKNTGDFPDISRKPFDDPSGPYNDPFSEEQHKFGPFQPIKDAMAKSQGLTR